VNASNAAADFTKAPQRIYYAAEAATLMDLPVVA